MDPQQILIDAANELLPWKLRAYAAEAQVEELKARVEELEELDNNG